VEVLSAIETYTPDKQPIPAVVVSEPRVTFIPNPRSPGKRLRQVVADVVQMNPNSPGELYVQPDVLLNFAVKREERTDPISGESFRLSMLPERIPGLDVDIETGEVLGLRELLTRSRDTVLNRAANGASATASAEPEAILED
jgi:hypothetical protein